MNKLIDFHHIESTCDDVTLGEALAEIKRENKTRQTAYARWAKAQPSKSKQYANQYRKTAAIAAVLATMTEVEWRRRMIAAFGQTELF